MAFRWRNPAVAANEEMKSITCNLNRRYLRLRSESGSALGNSAADRFPWLEDETGNMLGSIARGRTDQNWGYVILGRNKRGESEIWELASGFRDWREAELQLMLAMDATERE